MSNKPNFRCLLRNTPGPDKPPHEDSFGYEECPYPCHIKEGDIAVQNLYLSLDPALRCRMNDDTGVDYMKPWQLGATVLGIGGVGVVVESRNADFITGDIVTGQMNWPWAIYFTCKPGDISISITKVDEALHKNPQLVLSALGLTGLTAYIGVTEKGHVTTGANQTFVVSAAAGASGNLAGQIAKLLGCGRVVGICGTRDKCEYLTSQLGFDAAINYKTENVEQRLREACPEGIHAYFDNVGGDISETVICQMVPDSHVILCGQIAVYNQDLPYPPPISDRLTQYIQQNNITRERYLVLRYQDKFNTALAQLAEWVTSGKLKVPEFIHEGLKKAGSAFVNMMTGVQQDKVGKQMVRVSVR